MFESGGHGMASAEREPITGSGAEPPARSRGRAPGGGQRSPPKAESFLSIIIQKRGQKFMIKTEWFKLQEISANAHGSRDSISLISYKA